MAERCMDAGCGVGAVNRVGAVHSVGAVHGVGAEQGLGAVHGVGAGLLRLQPWHPVQGRAKHWCCPRGTRSLLALGRGPLLSPEGQPVVPDAGILQELINHMQNRCRKWALRKDHKSCAGNPKPCPRTILISPWCTPVLPIWPLLNPHTAVWALVLAPPVWSHAKAQPGKAAEGASGHAAGRCAGRVRQENQTWQKPWSTRPSKSSCGLCHPQFQLSSYSNTQISHANGQQSKHLKDSNPAGQVTSPGHTPTAGFVPSSPEALPTNMTKTCSPAGPTRALFNRHKAFGVLGHTPRSIAASLSCARFLCPLSGRCSVDASLLQSHVHAEAGLEQALGWGPGEICDGWTRFLSCQRGRWA